MPARTAAKRRLLARCIVIHDTSEQYLQHRPVPGNRLGERFTPVAADEESEFLKSARDQCRTPHLPWATRIFEKRSAGATIDGHAYRRYRWGRFHRISYRRCAVGVLARCRRHRQPLAARRRATGERRSTCVVRAYGYSRRGREANIS